MPSLDEIKSELDVRGPGALLRFVEAAWPIIQPGIDLVVAPHVVAICDHLEAVRRREIENLLMNLPPGCTKSLLVSAFFPCWCWTERPQDSFLFASYKQDLATRDSVRRRQLLTSEWYQGRWGHRVAFARDQNQKTQFRNTEQGVMLATMVGGGTGEHMDYVVVDDPNDIHRSESKLQRDTINNWWDRVISARGIARGVRKILIQQRTYVSDLSGHAMDGPGDWCKIILPMRAEPDRMEETPLGFRDERAEGELLCPELINAGAVATMEASMGPLWSAGLLQQRPVQAGGAIVKEQHFRYFWERSTLVDGEEETYYLLREDDGSERRIMARDCQLWFQTCDTALEIGQENDYTAVLTVCLTPPPQVCMLVQNVFRARIEVPDQFRMLVDQRSKYPMVKLQAVEKAASGTGLIQEGRRRGTPFYVLKADRSKLVRATAMLTAYAAGLIYHKAGAPWLPEFEQELTSFPTGDHDDQFDCGSYAAIIMQSHCYDRAQMDGKIAVWPPIDGDGEEDDESEPSRPGQSLAERMVGRRPEGIRKGPEKWW